MLPPSVLRLHQSQRVRLAAHLLLVCLCCVSCRTSAPAQANSAEALVRLKPIDVDPKHPERTNFGSLTLLRAFELTSKDKRFGGLSGLSLGADQRLYAVSDRGHWFSAKMEMGPDGALVDLTDWRTAPLLAPDGSPVGLHLRDAEALARAPDGSFWVAFEGRHRVWRYSAPPKTFHSRPLSVPIPPAVRRAPSNGGIECLAALPDGRLLIMMEEMENPDRSVKGWLIDNGRFEEFAYFPGRGFRVTDCAALSNGDMLVLERRYAPLGIFSVRVALVKAARIHFGAGLAGKELLKLEQPLAVENYEGIAVLEMARGTVIFIVSDDNFSAFQQTLLLQFLWPDTAK